jgi:predicted transcriptional regulator
MRMAHYMRMKLADYLAETNTTQAAFASQIDAPQPAVSRYAAGEQLPNPRRMAAIARATGGRVTANDFYASVAERAADSPEKAA